MRKLLEDIADEGPPGSQFHSATFGLRHGRPEMLPADLTDGVATQEGDRDAEVLWRGRTHIEGGAVDRNAGRTSVGRHDLWPLLTNPLDRWQPSHEVRFRAMPKPAPMTDTGAKQPGGRK